MADGREGNHPADRGRRQPRCHVLDRFLHGASPSLGLLCSATFSFAFQQDAVIAADTSLGIPA